jgi:MFS family permease
LRINSNSTNNNLNQDGTPKLLLRWIIALSILSISTTLYIGIESQWLNSYAHAIAGMDFILISFMVAMSGVIGTLFYLIWGSISDNIRTKYGRRVPIYVIGAFLTTGLMILFITSINVIWLIVCGGILLAITSNMFHVTIKGLLVDLTPQKSRGRLNSLLIVMGMIGSIIMWIPTLIFLPEGTESFSREIHELFILIIAFILTLSGISLVFLVKEPKVSEVPRKWTQDFKRLFNSKEMKQHNDFIKLFIARTFLIMSQNAFFPFLLILFQEITITTIEIVIGYPTVGVICGLGIFLLGRYCDKVGRRKIALLSLIVSPIGCIIIAFSNNAILWFIVGFGIMMPFNLGLWVSTDAWIQDLLPPERRGNFLGLINIGNALGKVPGILLAGLLASVYGVLSVFLVSGLILWIGIPFFLLVPETLKKAEI